FISSRRRHTRWPRDWSSDVCSSDLAFCADVYARHPRLRIDDGAVDVATLEQMAARLPARTAFIEYVSTNDWLDALLVRKNAEGRSEERRVGKEGRCRWGPDDNRQEV